MEEMIMVGVFIFLIDEVFLFLIVYICLVFVIFWFFGDDYIVFGGYIVGF